MDEPFYLTMQWLALQGARYDMFEELRVMQGGYGETLQISNNDMFPSQLRKENIREDVRIDFWQTSAKHMAIMYQQRLREGIR